MCRIAEARWGVGNRDAQRLIMHGTMIIDPGSRLTPGIGVGEAFAGDGPAAGLAVGTHALGDPQAERAFLRVAKCDVIRQGGNDHVEVDPAGLVIAAEPHGPLILEDFAPVWPDP